MALTSGTRLGAYEIGPRIGAGGMGEVYRARDTKLGREVALKTLPQSFAADPDRLARFEREAQVLASLNHPNIAALYGVEEAEGIRALVLELVEGPTIADRIAEGPIPTDDALLIARQVADALETAHEQGIIHRDLKPANVKVRPDGTVKVVDFGLAKSLEPIASLSPSQSPTITTPAMTHAGTILGTAAYMSPEQARGRAIDKRTDIWALGCLLYEMLTGARAFAAEGTADTLVAILTKEPDWRALPVHTPPAIRHLLRRCLQKEPRYRLQDMGDARIEIEEAMASPHEPMGARTALRPSRVRFVMAVLAAAVIAAAITSVSWWAFLPSPRASAPQVMRLALSLPDGQQLLSSDHRVVDVSPDGTQVAYATRNGLYVQSLRDGEARLLPGTDRSDPSRQPTFSRDGTFLVFRSANLFGAVPLGSGGAAQMLMSPTPINVSAARGGALISSGRQIISIGYGQSGFTTGQLEALGPTEYPGRPQLLSDDDTLLFALATGDSDDRWEEAGIVSVSRTSHQRSNLSRFNFRPQAGSDAVFLPTGHVVFARLGSLYAALFDETRRYFATPPVKVLEGVRQGSQYGSTGEAQFSVSGNGTLVYVPAAPRVSSSTVRSRFAMASIDRNGGTRVMQGVAGLFPRASPDGRWLALETITSEGREVAVSALNDAGTPNRLTFGGGHRFPVWSSDSQRVAFQSDRMDDDRAIFWQRIDRSQPAERLTSPGPDVAHVPLAISRNGTLLFDEERGPTHMLCALSLQDRAIERFTDITSNALVSAALSKDGRWLAYTVRKSARPPSLIVEPFPRTGARYEVVGSGEHPAWSSDGTELFYVREDRFVARKVITTSGFTTGNPVEIPRAFVSYGTSMPRAYDMVVSNRIVGSPIPEPQAPPSSIRVVLNWFEELKRLVPPERGT